MHSDINFRIVLTSLRISKNEPTERIWTKGYLIAFHKLWSQKPIQVRAFDASKVSESYHLASTRIYIQWKCNTQQDS